MIPGGSTGPPEAEEVVVISGGCVRGSVLERLATIELWLDCDMLEES